MELIIYILLFITIVIFLVIRFYPMVVKNNKSEKFSSVRSTECQFCCNMLQNRIDKHKCVHNCIWGITCDCCDIDNFL